MNYALFGGSFDPIHHGHITAAIRLIERCGMDRVVIIPAALPPHKRGRRIASFEDRRNMIALGIVDHPNLILSDIEAQREGPSYTIDTIERLIAAYPPEDVLHLVMGSDAFIELDTWRDWERILMTVPLLVVQRPTSGSLDPSGCDRTVSFLREVLHYTGPEIAGMDSISVWRHENRFPIRTVAIDALSVSSSEIRRRLRCGVSIQGLVPPAVEGYIVEKGLYRS